MRRNFLTLVLYASLAIGSLTVIGCNLADRFLTPDSATGRSAAEEALRIGVATGKIPEDYSAEILAAVIALQNAYLGARKIQESRKAKKQIS